MKKRVLVLLLAITTISYSQSTSSGYRALINAIGDGEKNTAAEMRAVFNAFTPSLYLKGDIKEVDCDNTYLALNFDSTGLGINERVGWAICNGLNGTKDRNGRVGIGYGSGYTGLGVTGGTKDAVVVSHSHTNSKFNPVNGSGNTYSFDAVGDKEHYGLTSTDTAGESGTNKNMQPYIVSLFIQKL